MKKSIWFNKNFALSAIGRLISRSGTNIQNFALSLFVLNTTGDPKLFASVLAMAALPQLIIGAFAGVIVDHFDRKKMIVSLDILSGVTIFIFTFIYITTGKFSIVYIYLLQIILSLANVFFSPTIGAILPNIVKKEKLPEANSINSFLDSASDMLSPIIAGIMYAAFGIIAVLVVNGISFIMSAISEMFITLPHNSTQKKPLNIKSFFDEFKEGFIFSINNRNTLAFCFSAIIANFALAPCFSVVIPVILKNQVGVSDQLFGLLTSVMISGMLLGPLIVPLLLKKFNYRAVVTYGFIAAGCVILIESLGFAIISSGGHINTIAPIILVGISGIAVLCVFIIIKIALMVSFQVVVPNDYYGRVGALGNTLGTATVPLGQMVCGFLVGVVSASGILLLIALLCLISGIVYNIISSESSKKGSELAGEA